MCNAEAPEDGRMWDFRIPRGINAFKFSQWMIFAGLPWVLSRDIQHEEGRRRLVGTSDVSSFASDPSPRGDSYCS